MLFIFCFDKYLVFINRVFIKTQSVFKLNLEICFSKKICFIKRNKPVIHNMFPVYFPSETARKNSASLAFLYGSFLQLNKARFPR